MNPATHLPKAFRFRTGACMTIGQIFELENGQLRYRTDSNLDGSLLNPDAAQWEQFWTAIEQAGVWDWKKDYSDYRILDGDYRELKITHAGRKLASGGSNGYPGGKGMRYAKTSAFAVFLRALEQLTVPVG